MRVIPIRQAQDSLSKLVEQVRHQGEEIVITVAGEAVARLVPVQPQTPKRLGLLAGKITVPDDFDAPLPDDVLKAFEGSN